MRDNILNSLIKFISRLPFVFHFTLSWMLYGILCYGFKYRKKVIEENLRNSFPKKTKKELQQIKKKFYKNFANFITDTLKLVTINQKQLEKRVRVSKDSIEELNRRHQNKEHIIVLSGHVFNWEYYALIPSQLEHTVLITYKVLKNKFWEELIKKMRERFGGIAVDYRKTYSTLLKLQKENHVTLTWIGGDQMPNWKKNTLIEERFLNQKTYFFNGINELSKKTNSPVYFLGIRKTTKSNYEIYFELITENPNEEGPHFITKKYAELLEELISEAPDNYLWTHKRWKKVPKKQL
jgi:KDO2-lipid IV(A) lauroyltransferase